MFKRLLLASVIAASTLAAQGPQLGQAGAINTKTTLKTMRDNVDRISPGLENERWNANVRLWEVEIGNPVPLSADALKGMKEDYNEIVSIVARIVNPDEKERWVANRDLWELMLKENCAPNAIVKSEMRALLRTMAANVNRIQAPGEKERWTANYDMWRATIGG